MKKFLKKNALTVSLLFYLFIILIFVIIVIALFLPNGKKSVYGNRLNDLEKHPITDNLKNSIENEAKKTDTVDKVTIDIKGKILYINVNSTVLFTKEQAITASNQILSVIDKDIQGYYDIQVTWKFIDSNLDDGEDNTIVISGYKNSKSETLVF